MQTEKRMSVSQFTSMYDCVFIVSAARLLLSAVLLVRLFSAIIMD